MGIVEYLSNKKKNGQKWERDNIELIRPVVNIFVGEFKDDEIAILKNTLEERIGATQKVFYCKVNLENANNNTDNRIYQFVCSKVSSVSEYEASSWERVCREVEQVSENDGLKKDVLDFVNNVHNMVAKVEYSSKGHIRLNYIVKMDSVQAAVLPTIAKVFDNCFLEYFINGVHSDAYCILDQRGYSCEEYGEERKALNYRNLTEVNALVENKLVTQAYLTSNYTSRGKLYDEEDCVQDQMQTIAFSIIIKEGKSVGNGANAYSNDSFVEETSGFNGNFCSLGRLKLEVAKELRSNVVYRTVFEDFCKTDCDEGIVNDLIRAMDLEREELESEINELLVSRAFGETFFYPMVINPVINPVEFLNAKREKLIDDIFGQNLNYFWELNCGFESRRRDELVERIIKRVNATLTGAYKNEECSLAEISQTISRVKELFEEYANEYSRRYQEMKRSFEIWLDETSGIANIRDKVKETDTLRAVYILAMQYMEKRTGIINAENFSYVSSKCLKGIEESAEYYKKQAVTLAVAADDLNEIIVGMESNTDSLTELVAGNMNNYYTQLTKDFLRSNMGYHTFKREMNNKILSRELIGEAIFERLVSYCEEVILSNERYPDDFTVEMLCRLKNYNGLVNEEKIYDMAFGRIMDSVNYYANFTEFGQIYEAVCFLVNPENEFVRCTNKRMNDLLTSQKMKIFYENFYKGMDILYMEGCFAVESLYQYTLYKKSWDELKQK